MSEQSVDLLIIGDGVSARAMLWELQLQGTDLNVLQVYSPALFPKTSLQSTGLVTYHGMKTGVSPLGDLLCAGVENFFSNVMGVGLEGLKFGRFIDCCPTDDERIKRRYGEAFDLEKLERLDIFSENKLKYFEEKAVFIEPTVFMESLLGQYNFPEHEDVLVSIKNKVAFFQSGKKVPFKKVVLAHGVGLCLLDGLGIESKLKISEVPGSYFSWQVDLGESSFGVGLGKTNLVYRSADKVLMLGGSTQKNELISHEGSELLSFYEKAQEVAGKILPPMDEAKIFSGTRVKAPKRMPLYFEIEEGVFILGAAYKSGWSQSFYGARQIVQKLL